MRALTLHQPWAWAVAEGIKRVENRTWAPPRSFISLPQPEQIFAIHAGKTWDESAYDALDRLLGPDEPDPPRSWEVVRGAVIAVARYDQLASNNNFYALGAPVVERELGADQVRWFFGPYGWLLADIVKLPEPVPCRGYQGLWTLPADVESDVVEQARAARIAAARAAPARCQVCAAPATCFGEYESCDGTQAGYGCDAHCGHGNEDGWCEVVSPPLRVTPEQLVCDSTYKTVTAEDDLGDDAEAILGKPLVDAMRRAKEDS